MSTTKTVKTTGAVWNLFYADKSAWPEDAYHDDTLLKINGMEAPDAELDNLPAVASVEILCGWVFLPGGSGVDLAEHFTSWHDDQLHTGFAFGSFRVTADKLHAVRMAILAAGGELIEQSKSAEADIAHLD